MPLYILAFKQKLCSCFSLEGSLLLTVLKTQTNKPKRHFRTERNFTSKLTYWSSYEKSLRFYSEILIAIET